MSPSMSPRDCDACREILCADPRSDRAREHLGECAACRAYHADMLAFDADIARALAIPVPAFDLTALPAADFAGEPFSARRQRGVPGSAWLALAATVVLGVLLGVRYAGEELVAPSLGEQILAHISHESGSLVRSDQPVGSERLARIVPGNIAELGPETGLVTYAQSCIINGHSVPHLVVQGEHGPVTILLMPHETVAEPQEFDDGVLQGVVLPVGEGSIAIVGEHPADLDRLRETMRNSVTWQI